MNNNQNSMLTIHFSGICFVLFAMFIANNPVLALRPYLPAPAAETLVPLSNAVDSINKNEKPTRDSNEVTWVDYKSPNFDRKSIGLSVAKKTNRIGMHEIDFNSNQIAALINTMLPIGNIVYIDGEQNRKQKIVHHDKCTDIKRNPYNKKSTKSNTYNNTMVDKKLIALKQRLANPLGHLDESLM